MADPKNDLAHETEHEEQRDNDAQAQTLAEEAMGRTASDYADGETEREKTPGTEDGDMQDLVDHMNQMRRGGIDMSAYAGEPNHDDNTGKYGRGNIMEDEPDNSDS